MHAEVCLCMAVFVMPRLHKICSGVTLGLRTPAAVLLQLSVVPSTSVFALATLGMGPVGWGQPVVLHQAGAAGCPALALRICTARLPCSPAIRTGLTAVWFDCCAVYRPP